MKAYAAFKDGKPMLDTISDSVDNSMWCYEHWSGHFGELIKSEIREIEITWEGEAKPEEVEI